MNGTAEQGTNIIISRTGPCEKTTLPREKSVKNDPLVEKDKFLFPSLHTKLGLMKNFIKAMDGNGRGFGYLKKKYFLNLVMAC